MIDTKKLALASPAEFSAGAHRLYATADALSEERSGSNAELNRWMSEAKARRMTWVEGLAFAISQMQQS